MRRFERGWKRSLPCSVTTTGPSRAATAGHAVRPKWACTTSKRCAAVAAAQLARRARVAAQAGREREQLDLDVAAPPQRLDLVAHERAERRPLGRRVHVRDDERAHRGAERTSRARCRGLVTIASRAVTRIRRRLARAPPRRRGAGLRGSRGGSDGGRDAVRADGRGARAAGARAGRGARAGDGRVRRPRAARRGADRRRRQGERRVLGHRDRRRGGQEAQGRDHGVGEG